MLFCNRCEVSAKFPENVVKLSFQKFIDRLLVTFNRAKSRKRKFDVQQMKSFLRRVADFFDQVAKSTPSNVWFFALANSTAIEFNLEISTSPRKEQLLDSSEKSGS